MRITQFLPAVSRGDGVTAGAFLFHELLTGLGYQSRIYAAQGAGLFGPEVQNFQTAEELDACSDLILIHHSMGHDFAQAIEQTNKPKVMTYHNITPATMFAPNSGEARYAELGRRQLAEWKSHFIGSIADSEYNASELSELGYSNVSVIPVLVDPRRFDEVTPNKPTLMRGVGEYVLVVGRIAENKRQDLLVEAISVWAELDQDCPVLVLSGGVTSPAYMELIWEEVLRLGLESKVLFLGRTTEEELVWLYQNAQLLWCASEHEGFCMPLLEAAHHKLPILSSATTNIPATLGRSGLMLEYMTASNLVAASKLVLQDSHLRQQIISAGEENLERFSIDVLQQQISEFFAELVSPEGWPK